MRALQSAKAKRPHCPAKCRYTEISDETGFYKLNLSRCPERRASASPSSEFSTRAGRLLASVARELAAAATGRQLEVLMIKAMRNQG
jgi:hypothetical protein